MSQDKEREAFERRMLDFGWRNFTGDVQGEPPCWYYANADLNARWIGWREARAALATQQAGQQKEIKHVQLDHDSNSTEPEQQRGMASSVAMGQPVGHGQDASASNIGAQGIQPVAEIAGIDEYGPCLNWYRHWTEFAEGTKLYASPPSREPLTNEQIEAVIRSMGFKSLNPYNFARAIERAHGIHSREGGSNDH